MNGNYKTNITRIKLYIYIIYIYINISYIYRDMYRWCTYIVIIVYVLYIYMYNHIPIPSNTNWRCSGVSNQQKLEISLGRTRPISNVVGPCPQSCHRMDWHPQVLSTMASWELPQAGNSPKSEQNNEKIIYRLGIFQQTMFDDTRVSNDWNYCFYSQM